MRKLLPAFTFLLVLAATTQLRAQSDSAGYFTSFDGTKIYYEVKGEGYPVVLVHGFIVNGDSWKKTALYNDLLNNGYRVISFDMRGNGKSDKPHNPAAYANDAEARDIMGLLNMLKVDRYNVVGYSRGSIIVARLLVLDKRVKSAVMGGMGVDFTNPEWPRRKMFYRALSGDTTVKDLQGMVKYVQQSGLDQQALACLQKEQPSTSKEALGKVKQPVLVICGSEDADNGNASELVKLLPHGERATVPGDHNNALRTKEFSGAVMDFFTRAGK